MLTNFVCGNPAHQIADRLMNVIYWRMSKGVYTFDVVGKYTNSSPSNSFVSEKENTS